MLGGVRAHVDAVDPSAGRPDGGDHAQVEGFGDLRVDETAPTADWLVTITKRKGADFAWDSARKAPGRKCTSSQERMYSSRFSTITPSRSRKIAGDNSP
jgi:hypothetical protein